MGDVGCNRFIGSIGLIGFIEVSGVSVQGEPHYGDLTPETRTPKPIISERRVASPAPLTTDTRIGDRPHSLQG